MSTLSLVFVTITVITWLYLYYRYELLALLLIPTLVLTYLFRFSLFSIPTNIYEITIYSSLAIWFFKYWQYREKLLLRLISLPYFIPLALIEVATIFSIIVSADQRIALGQAKGLIIPAHIVFVLVASYLIQRKESHPAKNYPLTLYHAYTLAGTIVSIGSLIYLALGQGTAPDGRLTFIFESPNYLAMFIAPLIPALAFLIITKYQKHLAWKLLSISLFALVLFLTKSYGAIIAVILATFFMSIFLLRKKQRLVVSVLIVLITTIGIASQWHTEKLQNILGHNHYNSLNSRKDIYTVALHAIRTHPIMGLGLKQFDGRDRIDLKNYWDNYASKILGRPPLDTEVLHPHNVFFATYLNLGLLGFLIFLWIVFYVFRNSFHKTSLAKQTNIKTIVMLSVLTILLHGLIDTTVWKNDLYLIFLYLLSL